MIVTLAATLGGSVFGDHCSPISDTTILSSTGANCRHIDHVRTQLPYAFTAATASIVGYLVAAATNFNVFATLGSGIVTLYLILFFMNKRSKRKYANEEIPAEENLSEDATV
jgi:Na+/H+ antiporter NhaC